MWAFQGVSWLQDPRMFPFPRSHFASRAPSKNHTDTCHGQTHNSPLLAKGTGGNIIISTLQRRKRKHSQVSCLARPLCRRHADVLPGSPGVSLTSSVGLSPNFCLLHCQWLSPPTFFKGRTLGYQNLCIRIPNSGEPEELGS